MQQNEDNVEISKRTARFSSFSYSISLLRNMPAVMALCLQINLGEMTLATGKRKIANAILPDRKDKQGAQLPVKPPPEAEADFAELVLRSRHGSLRPGYTVSGAPQPSPARRSEPGFYLGVNRGLHRLAEKLNPLELEWIRS